MPDWLQNQIRNAFREKNVYGLKLLNKMWLKAWREKSWQKSRI